MSRSKGTMSTVTDTAADVMDDTIETLSDALENVTETASKKSHKLLKLVIVLGVIGIIFAIVKQLTSDSEPEPYEPPKSSGTTAGSGNNTGTS